MATVIQKSLLSAFLVKAVKTVKQNYQAPKEILPPLFEEFRAMINEAIRVGIEKSISSRFKLSNEVYHSSFFVNNRLQTWYRLSAAQIASSLLKNYRREKRKNPNAKKLYVWKRFAKISVGFVV